MNKNVKQGRKYKTKRHIKQQWLIATNTTQDCSPFCLQYSNNAGKGMRNVLALVFQNACYTHVFLHHLHVLNSL